MPGDPSLSSNLGSHGGRKLSSDLHMYTVAPTLTHVIHTHTNNGKQRKSFFKNRGKVQDRLITVPERSG